MLSKCCTQYISKFGKSSSGHSTGKGQSSSQFPRRAVLKNVQTTKQLHSSPILVRLCSKSCMLGFSVIQTMNFQTSKLCLEKAEESENESHSVVSNSLRPHGLYSPWSFPGQNTGVGSLSLLQGIFPTQGLKPGRLHLQVDSLPAEPQGKRQRNQRSNCQHSLDHRGSKGIPERQLLLFHWLI